jgi:two-component system response regulator DevR
MISVALIEDNRLVREGLVALLEPTPDLIIVASHSNADDDVLSDLDHDIVLLDVGLWENDSLHLAAAIREKQPAAKVIIMDLLPIHEDIVEFVNAGVSGFVLKDATLEDLIATIRSVAGGLHVLPPPMTATLFSQIAKSALAREPATVMEAVRMTPREREVIALIGEGMSNKEIAENLNIATHTVKSHVRNVMEKLALHTRLQIAAFAHRERV